MISLVAFPLRVKQIKIIIIPPLKIQEPCKLFIIYLLEHHFGGKKSEVVGPGNENT